MRTAQERRLFDYLTQDPSRQARIERRRIEAYRRFISDPGSSEAWFWLEGYSKAQDKWIREAMTGLQSRIAA